MNKSNPKDWIGKTVEIDGEPMDKFNGDVGKVVSVGEAAAVVEFPDGVKIIRSFGALYIHES